MAQARWKKQSGRRRSLWQRFGSPDLLRWMSGLALFGLMAAGMFLLSDWLANPKTLPIGVVRIQGELEYLDPQGLRRAVQNRVRGGFFTVDVNAVRRQVLNLAWVDEVRVRRVWPDKLLLTVIEQQPLARWGEQRLLNRRGEIFAPEAGALPSGLPLLQGADESAVQMAAMLLAKQQLLAAYGLEIAMLERSARGAWQLQLSGGPRLQLGTREMLQRLVRFARLYRALSTEGGGVEQADLRYANGFAVRWARKPRQQAAVGKPKRLSRLVTKLSCGVS